MESALFRGPRFLLEALVEDLDANIHPWDILRGGDPEANHAEIQKLNPAQESASAR